MKIKVEAKLLRQVAVDMAVFPVQKDNEFFVSGLKEIERHKEDYLQGLQKKQIKQEMVVTPSSRLPFKSLYFCSPSHEKYYSPDEALKIVINNARIYAAKMGYKSILVALNGRDGTYALPLAAEALLLGAYSFDKYKDPKSSKNTVKSATLIVDESTLKEARESVKMQSAQSEIINQCRDVINDTPDKVYPESIAQIATRLSEQHGLSCDILNEENLRDLNYTGLLTVGRGSQYPPRLAVLRYTPDKDRDAAAGDVHLCLIGKGVTYDTGGHCLKPAPNMWEMKSDMAGAAVVIHAMAMLARLKPSYAVTAIAPLAQNAIGERAVLPGEIIKSPQGKTIHILNTDAEGRLILVDALFHAGKMKATHILDLATLTGSIVRAIGQSLAGVFVNDDEFADKIISSGKAGGEDIWRMPLYGEYGKLLKSEVADINNITSTPNAGAITAALFLQEFVPEKTKWAHLDIAGTAFFDKAWKYYSAGATAFGLKTLWQLIQTL